MTELKDILKEYLIVTVGGGGGQIELGTDDWKLASATILDIAKHHPGEEICIYFKISSVFSSSNSCGKHCV